ncbi:MAG: DNA polymerase III subunit gamma/tau, partial [Nitrospirota bacterium]
MNYQVLARKWRPQTFNDVVGQTHIVKTLTNAIEKGRTAHAYLFSGSRGLGKTSLARILAKGLNCEHGPTASPCNNCSMCIEIISATSVDVIEIDGASNTGVDDIRELKEDVRYIPLKGRYKIYIIDEVHMLSNSAFNALLKTLEEPPPHVIFIFATTEAHKIPQTILSRCQHFNFKRITYQDIMERLGFVAGKEGISLDERSSSIIARSSEGSMRDALILLDQVVSYCGKDVRQNDIETVLGLVGRERLSGLTNAIADKNAKIGLELIKALVDNSIDIRVFSKEYVEYVRDLLIARVVEAPDHLIERPKENIELIKKEAGLFSLDELQRLFAIFQQAHDEIARS